MLQPDVFFYCGLPSLIYLKQRAARPGPSLDFEFLRVLDFAGGLEAYRSGQVNVFSAVRGCFAEMLQVFGVDVEGYVSYAARSLGASFEEETAKTWFCCFETAMLSYPFSLNIFYRRVFDGERQESVLDRCHVGIFPTPTVLFLHEQRTKEEV